MTKGGTQAGALAWWNTIAPGNKVPDVWLTGGAPPIITSGDGMYLFTGTTNPDHSGYGNIDWIDDTGKSLSLYVTWGTDGKTSGGSGSSQPAPPDSGQVTPVQPFGSLDWTAGLGSFLGALTDKALWVRIGEGALAVTILVVGLILIMRKEGVLPNVPFPT
jgi:hypothetical protein